MKRLKQDNNLDVPGRAFGGWLAPQPFPSACSAGSFLKVNITRCANARRDVAIEPERASEITKHQNV